MPIPTVQDPLSLPGNVNFARAREGLMSSELLGAELEQCFPLMEMAAQ